MTIALTRTIAGQADGSSVALRWGVLRPSAGQLAVACIAAWQKMITGANTGWNAVTGGTYSTNGNYMRLFWRIADGTTNDDLTATFIAYTSGVAVAGAFSSPIGWPATPITQVQGNLDNVHFNSPYALTNALSGIVAGQMLAAFGLTLPPGDSITSAQMGGTNWTFAGGQFGSGQRSGMLSTNAIDTGTANVPTMQANLGGGSSFYCNNFISAVAISELSAPASLSGSGLFFGSP